MISNGNLYSYSQCDLVSEWAVKWLELTDLLTSLIWNDDPAVALIPPTIAQEQEYQFFRCWFKSHLGDFLQIWADYELDIESRSPGYLEAGESIPTNPFSILYKSDDLYHLIDDLCLQSGTSFWKPSRQLAPLIMDLTWMWGKVLSKLIDWVEARSY